MSNSATYGDQLQTKEGLKATSDVLAGKRLIGIYFSAHWCPPCRSFTPVLAKAYNDIKAVDPNALEIIFVSSDSSKKDFEEYYGSMPWTACLFDFDGKEALGDKHSVRGIPYLVIVNGETGKVIDKEGRTTVAGAKDDISKMLEVWNK